MSNKVIIGLGISLFLFIVSCNSSPYAQGERLYRSYCQNCHMNDGSGLKKLIPPLNNADYLQKYPEKVACLIRNGINEKIKVNGTFYEQAMPGYPELTEAQVTNIINYVNNSWDNSIGFTPLDSVFIWLDDCKVY